MSLISTIADWLVRLAARLRKADSMSLLGSAAKPQLTLELVRSEARQFVASLGTDHKELYGVTDGKAVGTYIEKKFNEYLQARFTYKNGNAASGIDFPDLSVDVKTTYINQPQSSCPFKAAEQKIYGLGYNLIVFVYDKKDDGVQGVAVLDFKHVVFVTAAKTADFQTTKGILDILAREGNKDDLVAFLEERNLPLDEIGRDRVAERILTDPPQQGYLTISNALQWRLQYTRVITLAAAGTDAGVVNLLA